MSFKQHCVLAVRLLCSAMAPKKVRQTRSAKAPKKVQQTCRANAPKKVRPAGLGLRAGSSTEFCVNGLRSRALAHKVKEKLDMSPCWLRDYYTGTLK